MTVHRIIEPLPDGISTPSDIEAFARRMAPLVVQEMAQTFGAVRNGENEVLSWIAHAWQLDGTFISLGVRPRARDAMLYLNTHGLERPLEQKSSQKWLWLFFVAISIGVGVFLCSFWAATGVLVGTVGTWTGVDIIRQVRRENSRAIDIADWNARFSAALREAAAQA
jgi:hypothetical protein